MLESHQLNLNPFNMAKKCCPGKIILVIVLILVIVGGLYWWKTNQETTDVTDETTEEITETEDVYSPSVNLKNALEEAENDLAMSLFRGDAELAPTYEEFIVNVNNAQDKLQAALEDYNEESEGKEVPDEVIDLLNNLETVNGDLSMSLLRGDAELAPTYSEFTETVRSINEKLGEHMEEIRVL